MIDPFWIQVAQFVALTAMVLAWIAYRRQHPREQALFRIEKTSYHDGNTLYYIQKRHLFNKWRTIEPIPGVRGHRSFREAERVLEDHLATIGIEMSETEVVKEYGL